MEGAGSLGGACGGACARFRHAVEGAGFTEQRDSTLLETLFVEFNTLAVVYEKEPRAFIAADKRPRDKETVLGSGATPAGLIVSIAAPASVAAPPFAVTTLVAEDAGEALHGNGTCSSYEDDEALARQLQAEENAAAGMDAPAPEPAPVPVPVLSPAPAEADLLGVGDDTPPPPAPPAAPDLLGDIGVSAPTPAPEQRSLVLGAPPKMDPATFQNAWGQLVEVSARRGLRVSISSGASAQVLDSALGVRRCATIASGEVVGSIKIFCYAQDASSKRVFIAQIVADRNSSTIEIVVKANDGDSSASASYSDYLLESLRPHIRIV